LPASIKIENSLVRRLFFISLPFTLLAGLLYAGSIVYMETQSLKASQHAQVEGQIKQLAQVIAIPTWNLDQQFINSYLKQYAEVPYIHCIELVSDANLKEHSPKDCQHPEKGAFLHTEPIIYEDQYIGVVVASFIIELDSRRLNFILLSRLPVALVALLSIFLVVFIVFKRWVVNPIQAMMHSIEQFQKDGQHHAVNWHSHDEVGTLVETFNEAQKRQINHEKNLTSERDKAKQALTELKTAQSQLVESEKMASLGSLVAGISHEINTPLGVARTSSSHVNDALTKVQKSFDDGSLTKSDMHSFLELSKDGLNLMTVNLIRASDLVNSFKKVSSDQSHDEIREFNLYDYLQETVYTLKPNLKRYQVAVLIECDEAIEWNSYPGAFSQIITNLIMNSLHHAYTKTELGSIRIYVTKNTDTLELSYQDDGSGMPPNVLKKIFDPFFTTKRGTGGTGLGMHIIYNLVTHKLQGTIEAHSEEGIGTRFTLKLPLTLKTEKQSTQSPVP
jgi:two-component system NtrC family sensor kinase